MTPPFHTLPPPPVPLSAPRLDTDRDTDSVPPEIGEYTPASSRISEAVEEGQRALGNLKALYREIRAQSEGRKH